MNSKQKMNMLLNTLVVLCVILLQQLTNLSASGTRGGNIALHKPARQSQFLLFFVPESGEADLGVDGGINNHYSANSCFCTTDRLLAPAWWEVDLQRFYTIGNIRILTCAEYAEKFHDFTIVVYESKYRPRKEKYCMKHTGPVETVWISVHCESPVTGRYVRIKKSKTDKYDVLVLCEVEIYEAQKTTIENYRFFRFQRILTTWTSTQGQEVMSRSLWKCMTVCGTTTDCVGFIVKPTKDEYFWCKIITDQALIEGNVEGGNKIYVYRLVKD